MITSETRDDEALKIAEEIVAARAHLAVLVEKFRRIVGNSGSGEGTGARPPAANGAASPSADSAASRILAVFQRQPGKKVTTQAVVAELSDLDVALVRSTINRFGRTGKLKSVKRGIYKLVPAIPGEDGEGRP